MTPRDQEELRDVHGVMDKPLDFSIADLDALGEPNICRMRWSAASKYREKRSRCLARSCAIVTVITLARDGGDGKSPDSCL